MILNIVFSPCYVAGKPKDRAGAVEWFAEQEPVLQHHGVPVPADVAVLHGELNGRPNCQPVPEAAQVVFTAPPNVGPSWIVRFGLDVRSRVTRARCHGAVRAGQPQHHRVWEEPLSVRARDESPQGLLRCPDEARRHQAGRGVRGHGDVQKTKSCSPFSRVVEPWCLNNFAFLWTMNSLEFHIYVPLGKSSSLLILRSNKSNEKNIQLLLLLRWYWISSELRVFKGFNQMVQNIKKMKKWNKRHDIEKSKENFPLDLLELLLPTRSHAAILMCPCSAAALMPAGVSHG